MGGVGSGTWYRWNAKDTVEGQLSIDIRQLKRDNFLTPGIAGIYRWHKGKDNISSICFRVEKERLILMYRYVYDDKNWEEVERTIHFSWTSCNYGGRRRWLMCPVNRCGRRVVVLYGSGGQFACRHCHNLAYECQREDALQRSIRRYDKIIFKIGGNMNASHYPDKLKNMHWRTYYRLIDQAEYFDLQIGEGMLRLMSKYGTEV